MKKKILSILLTLVMVLGMLPAANLTAYAEGSGDDCYIEIADTKIDDLNVAASGDGWEYIPGEIPTVRLNNYHGKGICLYDETPENGKDSYVSFKVIVDGDCTIAGSNFGIGLFTDTEFYHIVDGGVTSYLTISLEENASLTINTNVGIANRSFRPFTVIQGEATTANCKVDINASSVGISAYGSNIYVGSTDDGEYVIYGGDVAVNHGVILDVEAEIPFVVDNEGYAPSTLKVRSGAMVSMTSTTDEDFFGTGVYWGLYDISDEYTAYANRGKGELLIYIPAEPEFKNQTPAGNDGETTGLTGYTVGDTATFKFDSDTPNGFTVKKTAKLKGLVAGLDADQTVSNDTDSALTLTHKFENGGLYQLTETLELYFGSQLAGKKTHTFLISVFDPWVRNIDVSATFSGTPADATTDTTGAEVTETKWYRKSGSNWVQLGSFDTIYSGYTYRCEVTVAATGDYILADGYTVKINGVTATKGSGTNTWYVDKTITGEINYIDVVDIALPEVGARPDLDCDIESSYLDASKLKIEWFACDKDGKYITGTPLDATHLYQENTYYRVNVTVYAKENYVFDGQDLSAWINWKAANYYYNKDSSVTMFTVYHVDEVIGTYTVQIGDITLKDGEYLANNATAVSTSMPSGGYAYYNDGVLTLNNFVSKQLVRYDERFLEVELIGENEIGSITDSYYYSSNDYYTSLEFRGSGNLKMITYCKPASQISVNGDVFFNGSGYIYIDADISCFQYVENVIVNDGYVFFACSQFRIFADDTNLAVNGGKVELFDGGSWDSTYICNGPFNITAGDVFVGSNRAKLEDCDPWDGTTDLNKYDTVWIVNVPTYQVIFIGADDTVLDIVRVKEGRTVARPANPEDPLGAGRTFLGWYTDDGELFDFDTPITEKTYLTAKFKDLTITGSATNGIKVAVESFSGSATLIVAQYDGGKMVDVQTMTVSTDGTYTMNQLTHKTGCTYKAFLVNSTTYAPLCAADDF